jgi:Flp pilus assembly protein TadG
MVRIFKSHLKQFSMCSSGASALLFGLAVVPMLAAAGGAIDYGRAFALRQEMGVALDAAVLAAAAAYDENNTHDSQAETAAIAIGKKHFQAALKHINVEQMAEPNITLNTAKDGFTGSISMQMPTNLLQFAGLSEIEVSRETEALFGVVVPSGDLEVSMMLDVTGSMCDNGEGPCSGGVKMQALKDAAKLLVEKVVWEDQRTYTSKVAVVPFANRVRLSADGGANSTFTQITGLPTTWSGWQRVCLSGSGGGGSEGGGNWVCNSWQVQHLTNLKAMPCVTDRYYNASGKFDFTDQRPQTAKYLNAHDGSRNPVSADSANTTIVANGSTRAKAIDQWNYNSNGECADIQNNNVLLPLTSNITVLNNRIDGLQGFGGTAGTLGTAMTWYTLSPNWAAIWGAASAPKAYSLVTTLNSNGKPKLRKVAVLMTDGVYNSFRGWKDQDKRNMSDAAIEMCTKMKQAGIEIYTVGFSLSQLSATDKELAEGVLQSCGTSVDHFYSTVNGSDLVEAFEDIGSKVKSGSEGSIRLAR